MNETVTDITNTVPGVKRLSRRSDRHEQRHPDRGESVEFAEVRTKKGGPPPALTSEQSPERLAAENIGLVEYVIARRFPAADGDLREELRGAGFVALAEAARRFDPSKGFQFSTYAVNCIGAALWGANAYHRAGLFGSGTTKNFNAEKLATLPGVVSLDAPAPGGGGMDGRLTIASTLADPAASADRALLTAAGTEQFWKNVRRALTSLPPRDAQVIALRFLGEGDGGDGEPLSLQQVADRLGVTRQYVSQIEKRALANLRAHWRPGWADLVRN